MSLKPLCNFIVSGYGWGTYSIGTDQPDKFVLVGLVLGLLSIAFKNNWPTHRFSLFSKTTLIIGTLQLFISLWILSIWGSEGLNNLFFWSMIFGGIACFYIYIGLRYDFALARNYGMTFLFINLYTKFFEYFWDSMHKALFFIILGISFWVLASYSEKMWLLLGNYVKPNKETNQPEVIALELDNS